jgi:hypothetical protein
MVAAMSSIWSGFFPPPPEVDVPVPPPLLVLLPLPLLVLLPLPRVLVVELLEVKPPLLLFDEHATAHPRQPNPRVRSAKEIGFLDMSEFPFPRESGPQRQAAGV